MSSTELTILRGSSDCPVADQDLLRRSAATGELQTVEHCLRSGYDVNQPDSRGETALTLAVRSGCTRTLRTLLRHGADLLARNKDGKGVFHNCASIEPEMLRLVVEKMRSKGIAAGQIAEALLEAESPLLLAEWTGDWQILQLTCEKLGDPSRLKDRGSEALRDAITRADLSAIKYLIGFGADLAPLLSWGLLWVARQSFADRCCPYTDVLGTLLYNGADVNDPSEKDGLTARQWLGRGGSRSALELCVRYGADFTVNDRHDNGLLHHAAHNRDGAAMQLLLRTCRFLEVDARNSRGRTPLHVAADNVNLPCVRLLVESGANVNKECWDGLTPLYFLLKKREEDLHLISEKEVEKTKDRGKEAIKILLEYGADINRATPDGRSILFDTCIDEWRRILVHHIAKLEELKQHVSKKNYECIDGDSKLMICLQESRLQLAALRPFNLEGTLASCSIC